MIALFAMPYLALLAVVFFSGVTVIEQSDRRQCDVRGALSGAHATSGIGWALGIDDLGG